MKTLLVALNSKYIHSSLSVWYLKAACRDREGEVRVLESTINDNPDAVLASIFRKKADVVAFSCYIWNIGLVQMLTANLKRIAPHTIIILGGPEVSYDAERLLQENESVDFILTGEGEISLPRLLHALSGHAEPLAGIEGLVYREEGRILSNRHFPLVQELDSIPSPYTPEMLQTLTNRIVYYESSRGCPYSCTYCISSTFEGVRFFSMERVKEDLQRLFSTGVRQVKFVDRTFNCYRSRAKEIIRYVLGQAGETNIHFEAAADLFDEEMLQLLSQAPEGAIQLEIGIQTTNSNTLEAVSRKTDPAIVFSNIQRLKQSGNLHLHLDLIAGLPFEDFPSFGHSFNEVYGLASHQLQLGFLKLLKGSAIRREADKHGYVYRQYAPYELLCNRYISYEDILRLKDVEEVLERYFNSGRFARSLPWMMQSMNSSPFAFYLGLGAWCREEGLLDRPLASRELYGVLLRYAGLFLNNVELKVLNGLLVLDFLASDNTANLPAGLKRHSPEGFRDRVFEFLRDEDCIKQYLPDFVGVPARQIIKQVHFEAFGYNLLLNESNTGFPAEEIVVLFNYTRRNRVTGLYAYKAIDAAKFGL
jgi:radical SAM superfamily enzyme YgiQ (UPF0313 family)